MDDLQAFVDRARQPDYMPAEISGNPPVTPERDVSEYTGSNQGTVGYLLMKLKEVLGDRFHEIFQGVAPQQETPVPTRDDGQGLVQGILDAARARQPEDGYLMTKRMETARR